MREEEEEERERERERERAESTTARNSEMKRGHSLARKVVLVNNHGEIGQQIFPANCFPQTAPRALAFVGHSIIRRDQQTEADLSRGDPLPNRADDPAAGGPSILSLTRLFQVLVGPR